MIWDSLDTAPKRSSSSTSVSAISSSGTGCPSLNFRGRSTSKRRYGLFLRRRAFHLKANTFPGEMRKGFLGQHHLSRRPTLEREATREPAEGPAFRVAIREADDDHGGTLPGRMAASKRRRRTGTV